MRGALQGESKGFIYARFSNPTVTMFERRIAAFEGAEAARATASGMAAVTASLMGSQGGDHVVASRALFGSCRYVIAELLPRFGVASTLVHGLISPPGGRRSGRRPRSSSSKARPTRRWRSSTSPPSPPSPRRPGDARRRQRLEPDLAEAVRARGRLRRVFGDQTYRRRGAASAASSWRRRPSSRSTSTPSCARPGRPCRRSTPGCC